MLSTIKFPVIVAVAIAAITCAIPAGDAFAQPKKQRPVVVVPYVPAVAVCALLLLALESLFGLFRL